MVLSKRVVRLNQSISVELIRLNAFSLFISQVEKTSATKRSSRKRQSSSMSTSKDSLVIPPVVLIRQPSSSLSNYTHLVLAVTSFSICLWKLS